MQPTHMANVMHLNFSDETRTHHKMRDSQIAKLHETIPGQYEGQNCVVGVAHNRATYLGKHWKVFQLKLRSTGMVTLFPLPISPLF